MGEEREVTGGGAPGPQACSQQGGHLLSASDVGVQGKGWFAQGLLLLW